jgi:hypothetical protein
MVNQAQPQKELLVLRVRGLINVVNSCATALGGPTFGTSKGCSRLSHCSEGCEEPDFSLIARSDFVIKVYGAASIEKGFYDKNVTE